MTQHQVNHKKSSMWMAPLIGQARKACYKPRPPHSGCGLLGPPLVVAKMIANSRREVIMRNTRVAMRMHRRQHGKSFRVPVNKPRGEPLASIVPPIHRRPLAASAGLASTRITMRES